MVGDGRSEYCGWKCLDLIRDKVFRDIAVRHDGDFSLWLFRFWTRLFIVPSISDFVDGKRRSRGGGNDRRRRKMIRGSRRSGAAGAAVTTRGASLTRVGCGIQNEKEIKTEPYSSET